MDGQCTLRLLHYPPTVAAPTTRATQNQNGVGEKEMIMMVMIHFVGDVALTRIGAVSLFYFNEWVKMVWRMSAAKRRG